MLRPPATVRSGPGRVPVPGATSKKHVKIWCGPGVARLDKPPHSERLPFNRRQKDMVEPPSPRDGCRIDPLPGATMTRARKGWAAPAIGLGVALGLAALNTQTSSAQGQASAPTYSK